MIFKVSFCLFVGFFPPEKREGAKGEDRERERFLERERYFLLLFDSSFTYSIERLFLFYFT